MPAAGLLLLYMTIETGVNKGYWPLSWLIRKIYKFNPIIVKLCQNDQLMSRKIYLNCLHSLKIVDFYY